MKEKTLQSVLLMVGCLCLIAAFGLWFSGRVKGLMDTFYPLLFGVIFLGEYIRQKYYVKNEDNG